MENNIKGKVVTITGASSGMGEATAVYLAKCGARIVLGARGNDKLKHLAKQIIDGGGEASYLAIDVKKRDDLVKLIALATDTYGQLDVLINNAGVMPIGPLDDLKVDDWEEMIDVNLKGVLFGIAAALPVFRKQQFGHFINIGSTAAHKVVPNQSVYAGTKFAIRAITDGLRQESGENLRVTLISPGYTATNFADNVTNQDLKAQLEKSRDEFAMSPDDVARAIAYAIDQPAKVNIGEIVLRSTAQK